MINRITYTTNGIPDSDYTPIRTPEDTARILMDQCFDTKEMWREKAFALFLDSKNSVTGLLLLSVGGFDSTTFDRRLVVKAALDQMATGVIIAHNHPSGSPAPSNSDIENTRNISKALKTFGINLMDHLIITENSFYSFASEKVTKMPAGTARKQ